MKLEAQLVSCDQLTCNHTSDYTVICINTCHEMFYCITYKLTRGPWALSLCLWCLTWLAPHPVKFHASLTYMCCWSEVSCFLRCKFIYIYLFHCTVNTPKWPWILKDQRYPIYMFTATPDFQISLRFSLRTVFELQAILRQVHQMTPKWPWTLKHHTYEYKSWVHWHMGRISKLPYLAMKLGHWQKFQQKLHNTLFLPRRLKLSLLSLYRQQSFRDTGRFSKLPFLGMKLCHWQKIQKMHIHCVLSFCPMW